mmetsp:Transcript_64093/g.122282  ORF Transcript_64093/g.122282 Transcript_64093/m.122282 type:complete len:170 (+) Transcript_64093:641-1150(+)
MCGETLVLPARRTASNRSATTSPPTLRGCPFGEAFRDLPLVCAKFGEAVRDMALACVRLGEAVRDMPLAPICSVPGAGRKVLPISAPAIASGDGVGNCTFAPVVNGGTDRVRLLPNPNAEEVASGRGDALPALCTEPLKSTLPVDCHDTTSCHFPTWGENSRDILGCGG